MFPFTEDELQHNPDAVSLKGIEELFNRSSAAMQVGREQMLKPNAEKQQQQQRQKHGQRQFTSRWFASRFAGARSGGGLSTAAKEHSP